jgi:hypothetical protein
LPEFERDSQQSEHGATKATAWLPGLKIEIVHRQSPSGDAEQISIHLQAMPFFEAFGRFLETPIPSRFGCRRAGWLGFPGSKPRASRCCRLALRPRCRKPARTRGRRSSRTRNSTTAPCSMLEGAANSVRSLPIWGEGWGEGVTGGTDGSEPPSTKSFMLQERVALSPLGRGHERRSCARSI